MSPATHSDPPAPSPDAAGSPLLLAADIGGTSARIAVGPPGAAPEPAVGPGCNIRSSGPGALEALAPTVRAALAGRDGADVARAVVALSGAGAARRDELADALADLLAPLGIDPARVELVDDLHAAFRAGGAGPDGVLLLAGTGAAAARFEGGRLTARVDGMGWQLGDIGSAVWIGRHVLEAVAADIDGRRPRTALTEALGAALGLDLRDGLDSPTGDVRQDLIRAIDGLAPAQWGRFAPLPGQNLADPVARMILDRAIRALAQSVRRLDPGAELPVVLAGSVLCSGGPIRDELVTGLDAAGHPRILVAPSGIDGAWAIASEGPAFRP
ncbi:N-acetylglucosamine kinase [Brachybacterium huguangmaarense]